MTTPEERSPSPPAGMPAWLGASAIVALLYLALAVAFVPRFETMDDVAMAMWTSGLCMALEPQSHIIFSHELVGWVLKNLYQLWPAVGWYGWLHFLILFVSNVIFCRVLRRAGGWVGLAAFLAFFAACQMEAFVFMQFTKTAFYATFAGAVLLAETRPGQPPAKTFAAVALVVLGSLIRPESYVFALVVALPSLAVIWWQQAPTLCAMLRSRGATLALIVGLPLGVILATSIYDRLGPWEKYYDYRLYRSRVLDFGDHIVFDAKTRPVFDEIGWTENDLTMLRYFSFFDADVFSAEKYRHLLKAFPRAWLAPQAMAQLRTFVLSLWEPGYREILLATALLFLAGWRRRPAAGIIACWLSGAILLALILLFLKWPPNRVVLPILGFTFFLTAWRTVTDIAPFSRRRRLLLGGTIIAGTGLVLAQDLPDYIQQQQVFEERSAAAQQALAELKSSPEQLYFVWGGDFPYLQLFLPFNHHPELFKTHYQVGSWGIYNPTFEEMMRHFHVTNFYRDLPDRPDLILIGRPEFVAEYQRFMRENYHLEVEAQPVRLANYFYAWRIRSRGPAATP